MAILCVNYSPFYELQLDTVFDHYHNGAINLSVS